MGARAQTSLSSPGCQLPWLAASLPRGQRAATAGTSHALKGGTAMTRTVNTAVVARALGLSVSSIRAYARAGRIPCRQTPGGHYRFNVEEVRQSLFPAEVEFVDNLPSIDQDAPGAFVDTQLPGRDALADPAASHSRLAQAAFSSSDLHAPPSAVSADALQPNAGAEELGRLVDSTGKTAVAVLSRA
ncbi:helix-turn-helix domain-containing protein [Streptomyces asoensis]|uniref:helix-turn-helix domain-containing protein n=1 Tax=Streptomyces asoensis TaxID=249586 RepID=UPI0033C5B159